MFQVSPFVRSGWFVLYDSFSSFEYNPIASLTQATNDHHDVRKPLYSVFRSEGRIVVYQNQKPVTREQFKLFDDAFLFVESLCKDAFHQVDIFGSVDVLSGSVAKKAHYITSAFCRDSETFSG